MLEPPLGRYAVKMAEAMPLWVRLEKRIGEAAILSSTSILKT